MNETLPDEHDLLCTACSQKVRPIVAVDIDGTLGDYHGHLATFQSAYFGHNAFPFWDQYRGSNAEHALSDPHYDLRHGLKFQWCQWFNRPISDWHDMKLAYRQGGQKRSMPVMPGAKNFMHALGELSIEIWITTTRPYLRLDAVDPDTRFWLERHGFQYDHLLYDEDKYEVLQRQVDARRILAVIDDLPEQIRAAERVVGPRTDRAILVPRRHNALARGIEMAQGGTLDTSLRLAAEHFPTLTEHIDRLYEQWHTTITKENA